MGKLEQKHIEILKNAYHQYQNWANTDAGKKQLEEVWNKSELFRQKFSKENIPKISEDDFKKCWGDSFAGGFISIVGQDKWWKKHIIEKNGGFENVKQNTIKLLYSGEDVAERFENGVKNIKGFADSTVSEFLNNIYPDKCPVWNKKVRTALSNLGLEDVVPASLKDKISTSQDYKDCVDFLSSIKNALSEFDIKDYYDLDHIFWHNSMKKKSTKLKEFQFVEKDFESTTGEKNDAQYLHSRIKELHDVLVASLGDDFDGCESYAYHPFNRGTGKWKPYGWLGIIRKGTSEESKYDSLQFQLSVNQLDPLGIMLWLDGLANTKRRMILEKIQDNQENFLKLLKNLPLNYVIKFKKSRDEPWEIFEPSKISQKELERIMEILSIRKIEMFIGKTMSKAEAITQKNNVIEDVVKTYDNLIPIAKFLDGDIYTQITQNGSIPMSGQELDVFTDILLRKKQLIFYGPPGTGKTYTAKILADSVTNKNTSNPTLTFRESAIKILTEEGKPMHYEEITKRALEQKLIQTKGETPGFTMLKEMSKEIQILGDSATFTRVDKGTYGLNPNIDIEPELNWNKNPKTNHKFVRSVTFHQSYSYEEFIEGLRPQSINKQIVYNIEDGIFKILCEEAKADPNNKYVLLIDEINRGNISKIFGELITLIEKDKRGSILQLSYSKEDFSVPENLYIIGTMNTADRSLTQLDVALRRRFGFCELMPDYSIINHTIEEISLPILLENLNKKIRQYEGREKQIGHSYFMQDGVLLQTIEDLQFVFANEIIPLLQDYFYEDYDKLQQVLGNEFVDVKNMEIKSDWKENNDIFKNAIKKFVTNG